MRYIDMSEPGGPEVMVLREGEIPIPADGEILIKVHAAGVNRPDVLQRQGRYPLPPGVTHVMGLEVAGKVMAVGAGVNGWDISDRVCALTNGGGYAECVAVPAGQCLPVPAGLNMEEAAVLPETFFTVWTNVFDRAGLKRGERFLVHGGSSGIGTSAIQMARAMGAEVFTTAGSREKCAVCENLGASLAVNYHQQDFVKEIKAATSEYGVDVILDMVGGDYVNRNLQLAALNGRIVSIATLGGAQANIDVRQILLKRLVLTGSTLRPRSLAAKAAIADNLRQTIWPLIAAGQIRPQMAGRFPLAQAADAHRLMETGKHIGKIVLIVKE